MVVLSVKVLLTILITSSLCDELNEETRWVVVEEFVDPLILSRRMERGRRSTILKSSDTASESEIVLISIANWTLETLPNDRLVVSPSMEVHWVHSEDSRRKNISLPSRHPSECDVRQGHVMNDDDSIVVLTMCADEFYVMLRVDGRVFYVRPSANGRHILERMKTLPVVDKASSRSDAEGDVVGPISEMFERTRNYINVLSNFGRSDKLNRSRNFLDFKKTGVKLTRDKRESAECIGKEFYNLTGDTFELWSETRPINVEDFVEGFQDESEREKGVEELETVEELVVDGDTENVGYFFDRTWERTKLPKRKTFGKELSPRWLELGIAIDYSVIDFHGDRVQQYVLALLNIVSAIYKDPSLDSNLRLVIVRMIFYSEKKDGMVRQGNARKSLENVNKWNRRLLSESDENHDVAVWLTRLDIGGPSGYAPVSGACDPARSCALNRDEGLTSAFIIAHEVAHILGLTHDGDETAGNRCGEEASMGSVMAPMVAATFHRFHWSSCSRTEFHRRAKHFQCLGNKPSERNSTHLGSTLKETFTMDEQCRMEFGEGYALCRSFELPGQCSHLWCGHASTSQICKTKKGPPLEGTVCGEDKWCINGYCEPIDRNRFGLGPVINNARDGGWSPWTPWGKCSRSCGLGVRFRFRQCNEPTPDFGGKYCEGNSEDFKTCEQANCSVHVDLRQQQCLRLPTLVGFEETSPNFVMTWLPHESDQDHLRCRLSCRAAETNEIFVSQEYVVDGTPCYYGATDICVQGTCRQMGCDKVLNSPKKIDSCGVCDGDDSTCSRLGNKFQRKIRRGMTRVAVIPRASYNASVEVTIDQKLIRGNLTFTIRDARRRRNDLTKFDALGNGQTVIVEGAAFRSRKFGDKYEIWARGPVLSEIVVSLAVPAASVKRGLTISVVSRYIISHNEASKKPKYSWISGGWSSCSVTCGGGSRHKTVACKDDETGRIVNRKKCSLLSKPTQQAEKCNNFSCQFKWIPGPWEECSATCGNKGVQHRQIYCVHSSFSADVVTKENEVTVYRIMVSPIRCKSEHPPEHKRECNRSPCLGNWIFTDWSSCSRSCGKGIQSRVARCVPPDENEQHYECMGSPTPVELRTCRGHGRKSTGCDYFCLRDKSKYCVLLTLKRYCRLPGYRKRCCRSCRDDS